MRALLQKVYGADLRCVKEIADQSGLCLCISISELALSIEILTSFELKYAFDIVECKPLLLSICYIIYIKSCYHYFLNILAQYYVLVCQELDFYNFLERKKVY